MAYADDIRTIRDNILEELKNETARRRALTEAGKPPPATYSANGRSVDWNGYLKAMLDEVKKLNEELNEDEVFEIPVQLFT